MALTNCVDYTPPKEIYCTAYSYEDSLWQSVQN